MQPTWFTVSGDFRAVVADTTADTDHDPDVVPIQGKVTFTPVLETGDVILATQADPRPTGYVPVPIVGIIDPVDGRVKLRARPDDGVSEFTSVRLLADSPLLELKTPLFYRASFSEIRFAGKPGTIAAFTFQAPNADNDLNLITVMRQPGQPPSGITKIAPGAVRLDDQGRLQFSFAGVDSPDPVEISGLGGGGAATWAGITGKPAVIAAGATPQQAADVITAVRGARAGIAVWTGSEAEYTALAVKDPNTLYAVI